MLNNLLNKHKKPEVDYIKGICPAIIELSKK